MNKKIALAFMLFLGACSKYNSPILVERGVESFEREYHVTQEGYGIEPSLKKTFISGYVAEGMSQEMVGLLWGPPDRAFEENIVWEYVNREGSVITTVKFEKHIIRLGERVPIVSDVIGDRYGGSPAPGSKN